MRFTQGVHVVFEGDPVGLAPIVGPLTTIPIPRIDALDRVDPLDRVCPPIQGFFKEERIHYALHIASSNHDDKNDLSFTKTCRFMVFIGPNDHTDYKA